MKESYLLYLIDYIINHAAWDKKHKIDKQKWILDNCSWVELLLFQ